MAEALPFTTLILAEDQARGPEGGKSPGERHGDNLLLTLARRLRPISRNLAVVSGDPGGHNLPFVTLIKDEAPMQAPLSGLVLGMRRMQDDWYFVLGCGMPFVEIEAVRRLGELRHGYDAVALSAKSRIQPLHAFYSRKCLAPAEACLAKNDSSLRSLLGKVHLRLHHPGDARETALFARSCRDLDLSEKVDASHPEPPPERGEDPLKALKAWREARKKKREGR